jgi:hypothetical protein
MDDLADELAAAVEEDLVTFVADLRAVADSLMHMVARLREFRALPAGGGGGAGR